MRQKVGKERSQEVFAPLAIPHRFLACPLRKFGPSPTPEVVQTPGWSAQRHRKGRRFYESRQVQSQAQPRSPYDGRRHPPTDRTAAGKPRSQIARPSAAPRGGRNFVAAPPATGPSLKNNLVRRSLSARWVYFGRPRGFHLDCARAQRAKSLLRRAGDQKPASTALRGRRPFAGRAVPSGTRYWPDGREKPKACQNRHEAVTKKLIPCA